MFKLDFAKFMEYLEDALKTRNQDRRQLHYSEDESKFTLYIKSIDMWKYFVEVTKDSIEEFGRERRMDREQSIKEFKTNLLWSEVKVEGTVGAKCK